MATVSDDGFFDAGVAATYDVRHATPDADIALIVQRLQELAAGGDVLEFAIGTGRIALPLAEAGVTVKGIELSQAMVDQMAKKPGGAAIETVVGDMTTAKVDGAFSLVALVYNTIDNLTTQDAQVVCFQNAADHLDPGGRFVIETLVPPIRHLSPSSPHLAFDKSDTHWGIDTFDLVNQTFTSSHIWIENGETTHFSAPFRYAWPAEMDLMARLAGMTLEARWGDWDQSAFTAESRKHVSVWRKG